jgi:hypothetical protein
MLRGLLISGSILGLQLCLLVIGLGLMRKREIRVGRQVALAPTPLYVGLVLVLQFPLGLMAGFLLGMWAGMEANPGTDASQKGKRPAVPAKVQEVPAKFWWLDLAVPAGSAVLAATLLVAGLKDPPRKRKRRRRPEPEPQPEPEIVLLGSADMVRETDAAKAEVEQPEVVLLEVAADPGSADPPATATVTTTDPPLPLDRDFEPVGPDDRNAPRDVADHHHPPP